MQTEVFLTCRGWNSQAIWFVWCFGRQMLLIKSNNCTCWQTFFGAISHWEAVLVSVLGAFPIPRHGGSANWSIPRLQNASACCAVLDIERWQFLARALPRKHCKIWRWHNWGKNCERRENQFLGRKLHLLSGWCKTCHWRRQAQEAKSVGSQKQWSMQTVWLMSLSRSRGPFTNSKSCWKKRGWSSFGGVSLLVSPP